MTPSDFLMRIEKVHYKTDEVGGMFVNNENKMISMRAIEREKRRHREQEEFPAIVKL